MGSAEEFLAIPTGRCVNPPDKATPPGGRVVIDFIIQVFGVSHSTVVGAGAGGGVSMLLPREHFAMRLVHGAGGATIAVASTPLFSYVLEYPAKLDLPVSFLVGVFGFPAAQAAFRAFHAADLWGFLRDRFGGGKQQ